MYHGFTDAPRDDDPLHLFVEARAFDSQLDHLLSHGWEPLNLDRYLAVRAGGSCHRKSFLVTIDDGLESVATLAAPVLTRHSVPAVLLLPSGLLGQTATWLDSPPDEPILDADSVRRLLGSTEIEVGGHGFDHVSMPGLDDAELKSQTVEVRERLHELTGHDVRSFAYPFGDFDGNCLRAVRDAGYSVAFSVFEDRGAFAVSRVDVNATDTAWSFRLKLVPGYRVWWRMLERLRPLRRAIRAVSTTHRTRPAA